MSVKFSLKDLIKALHTVKVSHAQISEIMKLLEVTTADILQAAAEHIEEKFKSESTVGERLERHIKNFLRENSIENGGCILNSDTELGKMIEKFATNFYADQIKEGKTNDEIEEMGFKWADEGFKIRKDSQFGLMIMAKIDEYKANKG